MSTGYQINDQKAVYFLTFTIVDWVDLFTRKIYRDVLIDSFNFCCHEKQLLIFGYVIMSNHVHVIAKADGGITLSDIIRDFKKYTAKKILELIIREPESRREWLLHRFAYNAAQHLRNSRYQVWTHENHAVEIHSRKFFDQRLNYLHQNPVRAGYVSFPEDYVYSSAFEFAKRGDKIKLSDW
ncbi:REP-associated tyrosine transposase [Rurimicrobium arvi]|uniref:Transposase n=1 Tax=Rurimicrobium arvi TaxID=2049916 RepID=A0ABP8N0K0_9BACT